MNAMRPFKTMQPEFVLHSACFYQEIYAEYGISHFYMFAQKEKEEDVMAVPDGCTDVIFEYRNGEMKARVCGTVLQAATAFQKGERTCFGIRFQPGIRPAFLDMPLKELVGNQIPLQELPNTAALCRYMEEARTFEECIGNFLSVYTKEYAGTGDGTTAEDIFRAVSRLICASGGRQTLKNLEEASGYSARYLNRIFAEQAGLSPKLFSRIVRFQRTLEELNRNPDRNIADTALAAGYYDQSQMDHEFRQFCGMNPKVCKNRLQTEHYSRHLRNAPVPAV